MPAGETFVIAEGDDSPYSMIAVDEYHGGDLAAALHNPQRQWDRDLLTADQRHVRELLRVAWNEDATDAPDARDWRLNRLIDLSHVLRTFIDWAPRNHKEPYLGRNLSKVHQSRDAGSQSHTLAGVEWSTRIRCRRTPDGHESVLTLYGRAIAFHARLRALASRLLETAPPSLHLPNVMRIASEARNPLEWDASLRLALESVPGECMRWGAVQGEGRSIASPRQASQDRSGTKSLGPTVAELAAVAEISISTVGRIRKRAGIVVDERGAKAHNRPTPPSEVDRLIQAVVSGTFSKRQFIAKSWEKWSSKAASKQQSIK
ncbi:MAG: hypothetical protein KF787_03200 [Phycisphaeraceae bacterium]|nr:hypothetical protein [Phycisphaerae bacterium]MBX3391635.1 hypothetical protein [Phycisphaeraceae bacterium]